MKIFAYALRPFDELPCFEALSRELGFDFDWTDAYPTLENVALAAGAEGVTIITNPIAAELIDAFRAIGVRAIATRSIGYDHIDVVHARSAGLRVAHAAYPPEGVADYTIMLMLMALRRTKLVARHALAQDFSLKGKLGRSLAGCTVGVVGTGSIGARVVRNLSGFGCRILAYDPFPRDELRDQIEYVELSELLQTSDVVTLHAMALAENFHMIGADELALMKPDAVLVNTARGALVDTEALIAALEQGGIGGAALDTIEDEAGLYYLDRSRDVLSHRARAALMALPNVVLTPHMAFYTAENVEHMARSNAEALLALAAGDDSPYEVR